MNALLLTTLTLAGLALDCARQALLAAGELAPDWDVDPAAELALTSQRPAFEQLPVADALDTIRSRTARSSRRWRPW